MKKKKLNEHIRDLRKRRDLSLNEAAEKLGIKYSRLVNWENGRNEPNLDMLIKMCDVYGVSADELLQTAEEYALGLDEGKIIKVYRSLPEGMKEFFRMMVRLFEEFVAEPEVRMIPRPIYDTPASAGYGTFLDSSEYEMVDFPEDAVPPDATFGVRVSGNSMEPDYPNGSIVFAKQIKNLRPGDVGIFVFNNEGYIKKLGSESNLISINEEYDDIQVHEYDDLRVVGKVVGEPYIEEIAE